MNRSLSLSRNVSLSETLDAALTKGVIISGDLTVSLADVDLIFLGLRILLASVETSERMHLGYKDCGASSVFPVHSAAQPAAPAAGGRKETSREPASPSVGICTGERSEEHMATLPPLDTHPARIEKGLGRLVLTLVELIRQILEKQAMRRMDGASLSDAQVERLGEALMKLESKMEELRGVFGLEPEELRLDLGPLGNLD